MTMFRSPCPRPESIRLVFCEVLNALVANGMSLYNAANKAHWNTRGPLFGEMHALFGDVASGAAAWNDTLAERVATLGGVAVALSEEAMPLVTLPAFPVGETDAFKLCAALAGCVDAYNVKLYDAIDRADTMGLWVDVNDLSAIASAVEKLGWKLSATLEKTSA